MRPIWVASTVIARPRSQPPPGGSPRPCGPWGARLAEQQAQGRQYLIGDSLSALDIYWSTFAVFVAPLPLDLCPMDAALRAMFVNTDPVVAEALSPQLLAHRDRIYHDHLRLPMDF